jgi:hypothetical protein
MRLRAGYEKYDFLEKYVSFSPQRHIRLNAAIFETHPPPAVGSDRRVASLKIFHPRFLRSL